MFALFGAKSAAVGSACGRQYRFDIRATAVLALAAGFLAACGPATVPLASHDPADPNARVAGVAYRSTIAPYGSQRPATPAPWRERNDSVTPQQKSERAR